MRRIAAVPRPGWQGKVESQGLTFHTAEDGAPYWDESAYYEFTGRDVDAVEKATYVLNEVCLAAVEEIFRRGLLKQFGVPEPFHAWVRESWDKDEFTLYGRFDLLYDGQNPPKLVEYNADTPTALLEASVIQWHWLEDTQPRGDQFNSLHEKLIEAWGRYRQLAPERLYFSALAEHAEDETTLTYLRDTATQAGVENEALPIERIGWDARSREFVDEANRPIRRLFKLYPWEWLVREEFGRHLPEAPTRWLEPPWKMLLSCKALLPLLWELNPGHPNLLPASWSALPGCCVEKPIHGREGANIRILDEGRVRFETGGPYGGGPTIFQEFFPTPRFDGNSVVLGSWLIDGTAAGMGLREDAGLVTRDVSRFVPHVLG